MKKIAILPFALESHLNATFGLTKTLSLEYEPIFIVPEDCVQYVKLQGFNAEAISGYPFGYGFEYHNRDKIECSNDPFLDSLLDRLSNRIYKDRFIKITNLLEKIKPELVLIETSISTDFIVLYKFLKLHNIKICFFQTTLSTYKQKGIPMIHSGFSPINHFKNDIEWKLLNIKSIIQKNFQKLIYIGKDNRSIINKMIISNGIPSKYKLLSNNLHNVSFDNIPELIIAPTELEFIIKQNPKEIYIGSQLNLERKQVDFDANFNQKLKHIYSLKERNKIIYIAFGTLSKNHFKLVQLFFDKLCKIVPLFNEVIFVCSLQGIAMKLIEKELEEKLYIFTKIPQLTILPICDLFITHGGLGSIKESIYFEVPMLAYPLSKTTDQNGNCMKIQHHKIGISSNISKDSPVDIQNNINKVLTGDYKKNITIFNKKIQNNKSYSTVSILEAINSIPILD